VIIGIGVDIIEVARIAAALAHPRTGERFRRRIFTPGENAYCQPRRHGAQSYAARFAAKEAAMKALGDAYGWQEIEVIRHDSGAPSIQLHGRAAARAAELGVRRVHLSVSHIAEQAIAYVIAEG